MNLYIYYICMCVCLQKLSRFYIIFHSHFGHERAPCPAIRHGAVDLVLLAGLDGLPGRIVPVIREAGQGQRHRGPRRLSHAKGSG